MNRKGFLIALCMTFYLVICMYWFASGQSSFNPDSLRRVIKSGLDDPVKLELYMQLAKGYLTKSYYDTSVLYSDSAIVLSSRLKDWDKHAEMYVNKGKALYFNLGPEAGIGPYRESLRLYSGMGDSAGMVLALNGIGIMHKAMAQYDSALAYYIRLVSIAERNGYEQTLGMGYLNIGILYQDWFELDRASYYLAQSLPINKKYRRDLVGLAHMNMGLIHFEKAQYDSALAELHIAWNIYDSLGERKYLADVMNNIGNVYYRLSDLDSALLYYYSANKMYRVLENWYPFAQTLNNMANVKMGKGHVDRSLELLDSCLLIASRTGNLELEMSAYKNKFQAYLIINDHRKALRNYILQDSIQELIYSLDKKTMMADLEMKYQNEKKQAQILVLERDNLIKTKRNNIYLFTAIGIISLITFGFLYFRQRARKDRVIAQQRIRQLEEEKKLMAAKSLVEGQEEERKRIARELHDGLGVLLSTTRMQFSSIGDASPEARPIIEKASQLLEQASSDVRKISHNMMPGLLTKLGLYEAVADLFEKLSETEGLQVIADIPEDAERMPENREIMLFRIIQELANNTLKHAQASNIELRMELHPGELDVFYSDDGIGFNMEERLTSKSFGLSSIQSRVSFLNGKVDFHSEPGKGAAYTFAIPL